MDCCSYEVTRPHTIPNVPKDLGYRASGEWQIVTKWGSMFTVTRRMDVAEIKRAWDVLR
jgi:hypothetical protein